MGKPTPNFAEQLNPNAFKVPGTDELNQKAVDINKATNSIKFDWGASDTAASKLGGVSSYFQDQGAAEGRTTAGVRTKMNQERLGGGAATAAGLGQMLMRMGQKGAGQAAEAARAGDAQRQAYAQQAQNYRQVADQYKLGKMRAELALQQSQMAMARELQRAQDGLSTANLQLQLMYKQGLNAATNAKTVDTLNQQRIDSEKLFQYINAGIGAAVQVGSAYAAYSAGQTAKENAQLATNNAVASAGMAGSRDSSDVPNTGGNDGNNLSSLYGNGNDVA